MRNRRNENSIRGFVAFCKLLPVIIAILVICIGVIVVVNIGGSDKDVVEMISRITPIDPRIPVTPLDSAAEAFPDLEIQEDYLTINDYSRPGDSLGIVKKIVIHYTANPGSTAQANRNYFESLATNPVTSASSHFIIGTEGEIIQCVPLNEIAYATSEANGYSISIECCHPDESGEFTTATYNRCVVLTAELCNYYHLDPETDVIRHYDVTGKECPRFYVENPAEWDMFIGYVKDYVEALKPTI